MNGSISITHLLVKILSDQEQAKMYMGNPDQYLQNQGITDPQERKNIQDLVKIFMQHQQSGILLVNESFQNGLVKTNNQTVAGFKSTMLMYQVSFYTGIILLFASLAFAFLEKSSLYAILFGSIGTLDLLTFFIAKPPQSLQRSRLEQAKLNATFYSWFTNMYNWNSFFVQENNAGRHLDFDVVNKVSDAQLSCTERLMKIISEQTNTGAK